MEFFECKVVQQDIIILNNLDTFQLLEFE